MIAELRRELQEAMIAGEDEPLRFELGPVEVEASVTVEKEGSGEGKIRFWVVDLAADARVSRSSVQHIKLTLQPRLAVSGVAPYVAGSATDRER